VSPVPLYDAFGEDYDRFVDWQARLAFEMPFFRSLFQRRGVQRVLDVACGTGHHAIAFAQEGYRAEGADLSEAMIARARANAAAKSLSVPFHQLGFGELSAALEGPYDALTCLGNSLPHLLSEEELAQALADMAALLRPGGVLVIQNRNFDRVLAQKERFIPPQVHRAGEEEWIFFRFYDFAGVRLRFNVLWLYRRGNAPWQTRLEATWLRAWQRRELANFLQEAGLRPMAFYGSYREEPFAPQKSGDLIIVAERSG